MVVAMSQIETRERAMELPLLTVTEAARRRGVTRTTVDKAISSGRLPVYLTQSEHDGVPTRLVRPEDVDHLWSIRKHPLPHRIDDMPIFNAKTLADA